mmetsp:Transcript_66012/g.190434  ORF Transcript_66012/g.190434 Transcript_66012/m.190434 type:complete len:234 (-) Transcript_66012:275-976(-)
MQLREQRMVLVIQRNILAFQSAHLLLQDDIRLLEHVELLLLSPRFRHGLEPTSPHLLHSATACARASGPRRPLAQLAHHLLGLRGALGRLCLEESGPSARAQVRVRAIARAQLVLAAHRRSAARRGRHDLAAASPLQAATAAHRTSLPCAPWPPLSIDALRLVRARSLAADAVLGRAHRLARRCPALWDHLQRHGPFASSTAAVAVATAPLGPRAPNASRRRHIRRRLAGALR